MSDKERSVSLVQCQFFGTPRTEEWRIAWRAVTVLQEPPRKGPRLWCWSYRCTIAIMCCLSLVNMHAQQLAFVTSSGCSGNLSFSGQYSHNYYDVTCDMISNNSKVSQHLVDTNVADGKVEDLTPGVFLWGYLVSVLPCGMLASWTGGQKVLGYCHLTMSVTAILVPIATGFMHSYTVAGLKFIAGMMAGSTYPSVMAIWQKWAPPSERTILLAVTFSGIPLGILLTSSTKQVLCYHGWLGIDSWSGLLYILGSFGVLWSILWMLLTSSRPETNKRVTNAEKHFIAKCLGEENDATYKVPLTIVLRTRAFWALVLAQLATEWNLHMLVYVVPQYLEAVLHINVYTFFNGYFSTIPVCTFLFILLLCGTVVDCIAWPKHILIVRKIISVYGSIIVAAGLAIMSSLDCRHWVIIVSSLGLTFATHALQYCSVMVVPLEFSHRHAVLITAISLAIAHAAKLAGIFAVNFVSNLHNADGWPIIFYLSAGLSLFAGMSIAVCGCFLPPSLKKSSLLSGAGQPVEMLSNDVAPESSQFLTSNIAGCSSQNHFLGAPFGFIPPNNDDSFTSVDEHRVSDRFSSSHNHLVDGRDAGDRIRVGHTSSSVVSVV